MSKETGAPAPTYFTDQHAQSMLLRDYFAAKAMQTFLTQAKTRQQCEDIPMAAYRVADEMLKERSK